MSADPTLPQPRPVRQGFDPQRAAKVLRRLMLPFAVVAIGVFWWCFGALQVPAGMDTMPAIPPGSVCIIDKRKGSARVGHEVFVDLPQGGTLLSRVVDVDADDRLVLRNDDPQSRLPDSAQLGALPRHCLRGTVLVVFAADRPGEPIRGR